MRAGLRRHGIHVWMDTIRRLKRGWHRIIIRWISLLSHRIIRDGILGRRRYRPWVVRPPLWMQE